MSEIEIKTVEIKIGEKTIKLSLEQARELKGALNDLFPDPGYSWVVPAWPIYPIYPLCQPDDPYTTGGTEVNEQIDGLNITIY